MTTFRRFAISGDRIRRILELAYDPLLHRTGDIEVSVRIGRQLVERPRQVGGDIDHRVFIGCRKARQRRGQELWRINRFGARQDTSFPVDQISGRERVVGGLVGQEVAEGDGAGLQGGRGPVKVLRHLGHMFFDEAGLILDIGPHHRGGVLHHRLNPLGEPVLDAAIDEHRIEQRHHHRRGDGRQGEEGDEA